jgi:hypothetical protein
MANIANLYIQENAAQNNAKETEWQSGGWEHNSKIDMWHPPPDLLPELPKEEGDTCKSLKIGYNIENGWAKLVKHFDPGNLLLVLQGLTSDKWVDFLRKSPFSAPWLYGSLIIDLVP